MHLEFPPQLLQVSEAPLSEIVAQLSAVADHLPQLQISYERDIRTLWVTLQPEPKPVFTLPIIQSVWKLQTAVMKMWPSGRGSPVLFIAYRGTGPIFSLGGDLDFFLSCLLSNDRQALTEYASLAAEVTRVNATGLEGLVISLASIQGKALGGGIDPARACHVMIADESASFGYPEVNYNHFPISAVPILSRRIGLIEAQRVLLSGVDYSAAEFFRIGALDAVVPDGTGEEWIRQYAGRTASSHRARISLLSNFNRRSGDLRQELAAEAGAWVDHMMTLGPQDIAKLQRIARAQKKLLSRVRGATASLGVRPGPTRRELDQLRGLDE